MKKKKRTLVILLSIILALILGYIIIGTFKQKAALLVESDPLSNVYIDGKHVGVTPYKYEGMPGEVLLSMIPQDNALVRYETILNLKEKTQTIVRRKFEVGRGSSGILVYFTDAPLNKSYLSIVSVPDGKVLVNDHNLGQTPLRSPLSPGEHMVSISADGHDNGVMTINTLPGLTTNIRADLKKLP